jgi:hypothetical protein
MVDLFLIWPEVNQENWNKHLIIRCVDEAWISCESKLVCNSC